MTNTSACAERSVAAFRLAGHLELYETHLQALSRLGFDAGRYRLLARELDAIGAAAMVLPQLAADLMDIAIRHRGLVRLLCRTPSGGQPASIEAAAALLQRQCGLVRGVRDKCMRLIPGVRCRRPRQLRRRPSDHAPR